MNLFDRIILTIYSLALIVASVIAIGISSRLVPSEWVEGIVQNMYGVEPGMNIPYLVVSIIFLVISVRFFVSGLTMSRSRAQEAIRQRGEFGDVNISLDAIRSIAERAARKVRGVRDLKTVVRTLENGTFIFLMVGVDGETPLPDLSLRLQHDVKEQVEAVAGVDVTEVTVNVVEVVSNDQVSVRARRVD